MSDLRGGINLPSSNVALIPIAEARGFLARKDIKDRSRESCSSFGKPPQSKNSGQEQASPHRMRYADANLLRQKAENVREIQKV
jgi:hypothetical protein